MGEAANSEQTNLEGTEDLVRKLAGDTNIEILLDVPMKASVELGSSKLFVKEILDLVPGSIIELSRNVGDPVDLLINGRLVAKGEVVVVDDNFGFRITDFLKKDELKKEFDL